MTAALGSARPIEGRLAGLAYAPYRPPFRLAVFDPGFIDASRAIERGKNGIQSLSDLALLKVLQGRLDEAAAELEKATLARPEDAQLWSELAAVQLARGRAGSHARDAVLALDAAVRSLHLDPSLLEARFNLALALERFELSLQARRAWAEYLRRDPDSDWAREAAFHLSALEKAPGPSDRWKTILAAAVVRGDGGTVQKIVDGVRQPSRFYAESLLGLWAASFSAGHKEEAEQSLRLARSLGGALFVANGDRMVRDSVAVIDEALSTLDRARLAALVAGHLTYMRGERLYGKQDREALNAFQESAASLRTAGSPYSLWASLRAEFCNLYIPDYRGLLDRLDRLSGSFDQASYPSLAARLESVQGIANARLANLAASLRAYRLSLAGFERLGEVEHVAALSCMIAENLRFQGEINEAWEDRGRALELAHQAGSSVYFSNALFDAAEGALQQGLPQVALVFHREMVLLALREGDPLWITQTLLRESRTQRGVGQNERAAKNLERAEAWLTRIPPSERRRRLQADLDMATGEVLANVRPAKAIQSLDSAIEYCRTVGDRFRLPGLFRLRAQGRLATGELQLAEEDLRVGIEEYEAQRGRIDELLLKESYFEQAQQLFDTMIRLCAVRHARAAEAFSYAERFRARTVLDLVERRERRGSGSGVLNVEAVQSRLPPGVALVEYQVLSDQTLSWVLTRTHSAFVPLLISSKALEERVEALRIALIADDDTPMVRARCADLYDLLIRPLAAEIADARTLVFVPDKTLHRVSFAALLDRVTGHYLIEDRIVGFAPSATLYVKSLARWRELDGGSIASALVVGNPLIDHQLFGDLENLRAAEAEAREVAHLYDQPLLLIGEGATKAAVIAAAPRYDVIHFASHAQFNLGYPLLSMLVLAPERGKDGAGDTGALYARDIYGLHLDRTKLVVLAACDTSVGKISASEGVASLARPFLAAGVPAVLASLWSVDDNASAQLLVAFHRALRHGHGPLTALRTAQLSLCSKGQEIRSPSRWAAFTILGGASD